MVAEPVDGLFVTISDHLTPDLRCGGPKRFQGIWRTYSQMSRKSNGGPASYRRRKRAAMHAEAEEAEVVMPEITEHPDIPGGDAETIQSGEGLAGLVAELRSEGSFAYDTEFIGEETFYPKICVIQVATSKRLALIDPFEIEDLMPIWELVCRS